jgi:hypothetical protein
MQSLGVPNKPSFTGTCCLVALALPDLGSRDKRVTAVIGAYCIMYIEGYPHFNMTGDAGNAVGNAIRQLEDKAYNQ